LLHEYREAIDYLHHSNSKPDLIALFDEKITLIKKIRKNLEKGIETDEELPFPITPFLILGMSEEERLKQFAG